MCRTLVILYLLCTISIQTINGQVALGVTYGLDLYQHLQNPYTDEVESHSTGSAIFNLNIGPKLWVGGEGFSVSMEAQAGMAPFSLDLDGYKGLGAAYFPVLACVNFAGLSGFQDVGGFGFSIGGGMQISRTELYFLDKDYEDVPRDFFETIFGQINIGLGKKHQAVYMYLRYGAGDNDAHAYHIGLMLDHNLTSRKDKRNDKNK
jgi:hypothetical protein